MSLKNHCSEVCINIFFFHLNTTGLFTWTNMWPAFWKMICNWQQVCNRIGCKNCFSPEFLKSKDGQRSVKKSIIKLWNNFRIMFHIVKLWRLLTSHHLHGRSSKERIWRNLCVQVTRSKIMSVIFGLWAGSHCMGSGTLLEIAVCE